MTSGFEDLVRQHQRRIFTFARYFLADSGEAEDVAQEVFLKLWRNQSKLDEDRIGAWLHRVTRNACYDRLRKRRSASRVFAPGLEEGALETIAAPEPGPESQAQASAFRERLQEALGQLDEPYRSILIMREIQGFKYREISSALEMPLNTVRVYLHRGRRRLRQLLEGWVDHE